MKYSRLNSRRRARRPLGSPKPLWFVALMHLAALGLALVLFALPHHVIPRHRESMGIVSERGAAPVSTAETAAPAAEPASDPQTEAANAGEPADAAESAEPAAEAEPTAEPRVGDFSAKFADKFIQGDPVYTDTTYVSENLNITLTDYNVNNVYFYVADIYIRDISCFRTAFAKDKFGRGYTEDIDSVASRLNSVLTISGDYYGTRDDGVCVRNGEMYINDKVYREIGVLYWDGTFQTFDKDTFDGTREMANGAYQIWNFGPGVLDSDGNPRTSFPSFYDGITKRQPRAALGYFEPGHYCFIAVEGRLSRSRGLSLTEMGKLAQNLGLQQLYNLDGGKTAMMAFGTTVVNTPPAGGRPCSDYLTILDSIS